MRKATKRNANKFILVALPLAAAVFAVYGLSLLVNAEENAAPYMPSAPSIPAEGNVVRNFYHAHADFKVFINGNELDFAKGRYDAKSSRIHIHVTNDFGGYIIHMHDRKATLGDFFASLNMGFNSTCFATESQAYCNGNSSSLRFFVNGVPAQNFGDYAPQDLDRILITYSSGNEEEIKAQIDSVTGVSCAFSQLCEIPQELVGQTLL